jgi:hypothetical protein
MKICPTCGLDADDRFLFCPDDGTALDRPVAGPSLLDEPSSGRASKVSLYFCPACEGEYPLTFSVCPIDGLKLTRERVLSKRPEAVAIKVASPGPIKSPTPTAEVVEPFEEEMASDETAHYDSPDATLDESDPEPDLEVTPSATKAGPIERFRSDRPSFQFAAIATLIGLTLFGLSAIYRIYTYGARGPDRASPETTALKQQEAPPSFFIETPREAREYVEEAAPAQEAVAEVKEQEVMPAVRPSKETPAPDKAPVKKAAEPPAAPAADRPRTGTAPVVPQSTGGRVEARLLTLPAAKAEGFLGH